MLAEHPRVRERTHQHFLIIDEDVPVTCFETCVTSDGTVVSVVSPSCHDDVARLDVPVADLTTNRQIEGRGQNRMTKVELSICRVEHVLVNGFPQSLATAFHYHEKNSSPLNRQQNGT